MRERTRTWQRCYTSKTSPLSVQQCIKFQFFTRASRKRTSEKTWCVIYHTAMAGGQIFLCKCHTLNSSHIQTHTHTLWYYISYWKHDTVSLSFQYRTLLLTEERESLDLVARNTNCKSEQRSRNKTLVLQHRSSDKQERTDDQADCEQQQQFSQTALNFHFFSSSLHL